MAVAQTQAHGMGQAENGPAIQPAQKWRQDAADSIAGDGKQY